MKRIVFDIFVILVAVGTIWYVYANYGEDIFAFLFGQQSSTIYIEDLAISVSVADEPEERRQGLSGVTELGELEGKLFVFEEEKQLGIWMKDMLMDIDILWINSDMEIVHIVEQVSPDTFPETFSNTEPAQFVLETNAFFVESFKIEEGDRVTIPAGLLPDELRKEVVDQAAEDLQ